MKLSLLFGSVLFLALGQIALASTTWYVDGVSGSDGNDCKSTTAACKTIGHAISLASSGDLISVAAATYTENLTIPFSLKIIGAGAATTILDGGGIAPVVSIPILGPTQPVTLAKVTIRNGLGGYPFFGGGVLNEGTLLIIYSIITGNNAGSGHGNTGGGVGNAGGGTLTIDKTTITGNTADYGGGIGCSDNNTKLLIYNSTISDNVAGAGGGIFNDYCNLTITNDTISGNSGGGITTLTLGSVKINNSTIARNSAGGISAPSNVPLNIQNSIIANNTGGNCAGNGIASAGYNLSSDDTCTTFNAAGDLNNTDPMLRPLQKNGGPTPTMAPLPGSPAVDSGNPAGCTDGNGHPLLNDQRGYRRPDKEDSGGCDRGAFELQSH